MNHPILSHQKEIQITKEFLDENQHVNNVEYVKWVEMIAIEHWELIKSKTLYKNHIWLLVDHHIKYKKQAYKGDILLVRTFPLSPNGVRQPRKVEFYIGDTLIADSLTQWVLIHPESKKITRIDPNWLDF
jgi:acyl-CoA thioester hydrolase